LFLLDIVKLTQSQISSTLWNFNIEEFPNTCRATYSIDFSQWASDPNIVLLSFKSLPVFISFLQKLFEMEKILSTLFIKKLPYDFKFDDIVRILATFFFWIVFFCFYSFKSRQHFVLLNIRPITDIFIKKINKLAIDS